MPISWKLSKFSVFGTCPDYSGGAECYHQKYCQRTITLLLEVMSLGRCRRDRRKWCGRDPGQTHSLSPPYPSVTVPVGEPVGDGGCGQNVQGTTVVDFFLPEKAKSSKSIQETPPR